MVAGKLLVLPIRPGMGIVSVLLVGKEIEPGFGSWAGSAMASVRNMVARMMRENGVTGHPRKLFCKRDERNSGRGMVKAVNGAPRKRLTEPTAPVRCKRSFDSTE